MDSDYKIIQETNSIQITVKIVPGSSKTAHAGILDGMLKIKIAAPPEKGKANKALITYLSKKLAIKKTDIEIVSGQTNPVKYLRIVGTEISKLIDLFKN